MKKFVLMATMMLAVIMGACTKQGQRLTSSPTPVNTVESVVHADRQYMCDNFGCDFMYYETQLTLKDYIDAEDCDGTVVNIVNIFQQCIAIDETSGNSYVYQFTHSGEEMMLKRMQGIWIEDYDMSGDNIKITYRQAYERLMQSNYDKPHSSKCTLRKMVGRYPCNPQYIFGNTSQCLFVDAVTGEVSDLNPAFNKRE